ncbi:MAG TPA: hypothetical protein VEZ48_03975 [Sphingomonadaceae bacterium]|nr:hypothetical protein [Sphingomonadaceae bacterium]
MALAAAFVLQLWLYLSEFAMLYGAKLNPEVARQSALLTRRGCAPGGLS